MAEAWVLVVSCADRSGIMHTWGPFISQDYALDAGRKLSDIGVGGLFEAFPLRSNAPTAPAWLYQELAKDQP